MMDQAKVIEAMAAEAAYQGRRRLAGLLFDAAVEVRVWRAVEQLAAPVRARGRAALCRDGEAVFGPPA